MKDFNIDLYSLEELIGKDNLFKMSKGGMVNFFNNLSIFITNYNVLKNELIHIFNKCVLEGINPGDACSKCRTSLQGLEDINYIAPNFLNNIFTFKEMNLFVDVNRKLITNISDIIGIIDRCVSEFNYNVSDEKNKINIEFPIAPHSYEGEGDLIGNWNVIGKKGVTNSNYTINGNFFSIGYWGSDDDFKNLIDNTYKKGDRELGLLLYDQAQINKALENLNDFIEELKDKLLYCPLNFKDSYDSEEVNFNNFYFGYQNLSMQLNKEEDSAECSTLLYSLRQDYRKVYSIQLKTKQNHSDYAFFTTVNRNADLNDRAKINLKETKMFIDEMEFANYKDDFSIYPKNTDFASREFYLTNVDTTFSNLSLKSNELKIVYFLNYSFSNIDTDLEIGFSSSARNGAPKTALTLTIQYYKLKIESFDN